MDVMVSSGFGGNTPSPPYFAKSYSSAPSSPSRIPPHLHPDLDDFFALNDAPSSTASSVQKADHHNRDADEDFAFSVSQDSDAASLTAEELFDGGRIRPLKADHFPSLTKRSLLSNRDDKGVDHSLSSQKTNREPPEERRGRDTTPAALFPSSSGRRGARSLSPHRVSQHTWDEEHEQRRAQHQRQGTREESSSSSKSSRRWKLRDFLLFRSASEGRGSGKDPLRKYSVYKKPEGVKSSAVDSPTGSSRKGPISPHEFHYAIKKAQSQDLKKKTFLPYKQGILGRLAGLGSHTR